MAITKEKEEIKQSELSKIRGKYILKHNRKTWLSRMPGNKDGRDFHEGTFTLFTPELDSISRSIITGLNPTQQAEFEEELMLNPKTLSRFNREFWSRHFIKIPPSGLILDCDSRVMDKLNYIILKNSTKVYSDGTIGAANKNVAEFLLLSPEVEKAKESKKLDTLTSAYAKLSEMSIGERMDFLKVFEEGKYSVNNDSKPDFINAAIKNILEKSPEQFLDTFRNPYYRQAVFLRNCMSKKLIVKQGPNYYVNGGEKIGGSYLEALNNLASDDWSDTVTSLLVKLEASK